MSPHKCTDRENSLLLKLFGQVSPLKIIDRYNNPKLIFLPNSPGAHDSTQQLKFIVNKCYVLINLILDSWDPLNFAFVPIWPSWANTDTCTYIGLGQLGVGFFSQASHVFGGKSWGLREVNHFGRQRTRIHGKTKQKSEIFQKPCEL